MKSKESVMIETEKIKANPFQPRQDFDEEGLKELSESIKVHGLIQPVVVRRTNGNYQLIAGERRLKACAEAGMDTIPAIIVDIDGVDVAEVSLIENIQRKDLNCIEEATAFNILKSRFGMTQEEIAERLGKSRSYIGNTLRMLELPESIKKSLFEEKLTMGHARSLLSLPTEELMLEVQERIFRDALSVRQTEALVQEILSGSKIVKKRKQRIAKYFKDARIYYNSIKKVLKDIRESGGKADLIEKETEDYLELIVRIPKGETMLNQQEMNNTSGDANDETGD